MPLIDPPLLLSSLKNSQRLLGVDYGEKSIGLALSDTRRKIASSYKTLEGKGVKRDANNIINAMEEMECGGIVIGFPLHMNGTEGERCKITRGLVHVLLLLNDCPVLLWDERLSTKAVEGVMLSGDLSRKKRKKSIDKMAAAYILQGALDALSYYEQPGAN